LNIGKHVFKQLIGLTLTKKNQAKVSEVAEECREAELPDYTCEEALANDRLMTAMKKT